MLGATRLTPLSLSVLFWGKIRREIRFCVKETLGFDSARPSLDIGKHVLELQSLYKWTGRGRPRPGGAVTRSGGGCEPQYKSTVVSTAQCALASSRLLLAELSQTAMPAMQAGSQAVL